MTVTPEILRRIAEEQVDGLHGFGPGALLGRKSVVLSKAADRIEALEKIVSLLKEYRDYSTPDPKGLNRTDLLRRIGVALAAADKT